MERIEISVQNRVAWQTNSTDYICGNSDFVVGFVFDDEWNKFETKTARFIHGGEHTDIVFSGNECNVPKILNAKRVEIGVFAGNLYTTTPAFVHCRKSILCSSGIPADPPPDVYAQIMEMLRNGAKKSELPTKVSQLDNDAGYLTEHQDISGKLNASELPNAINTALAQAKASGEFDGDDGKTAYQYAKDGGFTGTEEEFAKKMAQEAEWMATKELAGGDTIYIPEQNLSKSIWKNLKLSLQTGCFYDVTLNGEVYSCEALTDDGSVILGNNPSLTLNDYPFCISWAGGTATMGMFFKRSDISYPVTLKVTDHAEYVYDKMPEGYLPDCVVKSVNGEKPDASGNVTVETGSGGGVDVTAQVGQTIVVEEVDANGKPTKWKPADYPLVVNEMIPKTTYTPQYDSAYGCYLFGFETETVLAAGQKYIVIFDGVEYPCTAKRATVGTMSATYIGNGVLAGNQTGEPFALVDMDGYDGYLVMANLDADAHSFSLMSKKLNDDYVPQSVYPYYIDVNFEVTEENPNVCNDTVANVEAIYASGRMIGVKMKMDGGAELIYYPYAAVLEPSISPYGLTFMFGIPVVNTMLFLVPQEDGTYTATDNLDG